MQELRALQSQLHNAADYCETAFLKGKEKKNVLENTKEYICRAVVTVVDHLGNVSANLECLISQTNAFSEAEIRINCLKQRLLSCEQYAHKLALTRVQWSENLPRFHSRYLSSCKYFMSLQISLLLCRDSGSEVPSKIEDFHVLETEEDLPLFMYTQKSCPMKNLKSNTDTIKEHKNLTLVVPVRDKFPVSTNIPNPKFHFQGTQKKNGRHRKSLHGSDILWLIRRRKQ
ncbi:putative protein ABIL5 [Senna tora]|uniref:Protein ABIL5 n=1 Tax=Senna tora TaxID=362788 RepID=A0A834W976_9FABA|nr:putative protein ABIL5 [Senna tora]